MTTFLRVAALVLTAFAFQVTVAAPRPALAETAVPFVGSRPAPAKRAASLPSKRKGVVRRAKGRKTIARGKAAPRGLPAKRQARRTAVAKRAAPAAAVAPAAALAPVAAANQATPPGPQTGEELALRLAACRSGRQASADRFAHCSWIIDREQVDGAIRAEAFLNRGLVHLNEGHPARAVPDFDRALALDLRGPAGYASRAEAFWEMGQPDKAIEDYGRAIDADAKSADLLANRGEVHRRKGDREKAKSDFEAALALDGQHKVAAAGLKALTAQ